MNDLSFSFASWELDYPRLMSYAGEMPYDEICTLLLEELPEGWKDKYTNNASREVSFYRLASGPFHYIYDDAERLLAEGVLDDDGKMESRMVAVFGRSSPSVHSRKSDDSRLKGWLKKIRDRHGKVDKGHFMAHSMGGRVNQSEFNIFIQAADINQGHSERGKIFRQMEAYCAANPATFCFNRPIYGDSSSKPFMFEYGVLKNDGELWVELFDNRVA